MIVINIKGSFLFYGWDFCWNTGPSGSPRGRTFLHSSNSCSTNAAQIWTLCAALMLGIQSYRRILTDLKEIYNATGPWSRSPHIRMAYTVPVFPLRMVSTVPWTLPMTTTWSGDGQQPPPQRTFELIWPAHLMNKLHLFSFTIFPPNDFSKNLTKDMQERSLQLLTALGGPRWLGGRGWLSQWPGRPWPSQWLPAQEWRSW